MFAHSFIHSFIQSAFFLRTVPYFFQTKLKECELVVLFEFLVSSRFRKVTNSCLHLLPLLVTSIFPSIFYSWTCSRREVLRELWQIQLTFFFYFTFNPLNAELNPICHLLVLLGDLTFMSPCIVSIFQYTSNKMQRYTVYLYLETALHVSDGTSTHHQEGIQLYLQHLVFVTPLLLSAAIVEELEPVWVCCGWRTRCCRYSCMPFWWWVEVQPETSRAVSRYK
jgi:hypothetical protein